MRCSAPMQRRSTSPARKAARRWRCARAASAWTTRRCSVLAEIQLEKILATHRRPSGRRSCVIDSIQTVYSDQLTSAPGSVAQVRECAAQLTRAAKAERHRDRAGRPRHQGRRARRPARAGAHGRHGAVLRRRHAFELSPGARHQEPLRRGQRDRRVRDDREGPEGRGQPERDLPVDSTASRCRASCVLVTLEGTRPMLVEIQALVDSRRARARGACRSAWTATAWRCCWRCCTAMPASPAWTRTCSSTRSAACASASRRPTWR